MTTQRFASARRAAWSAVVLGLALLACSQEPGGQGATASATAAPAEAPALAAVERPRLVLLISIDTLRADHLGFYGYQRFTSPVLDGIAAEGTVFDDASATASWTLPSHASMLTGLFPLSDGVLSFRTRLPDEIPTIASILGKAGWETAAVVNVEWLKRENYGLTRDFEKYAWAESSLSRRSSNTWVTDQMLQWVDEIGDRPLFIFAHYYDLHTDYVAADAYEKLFLTPYDGIVDGTGWQLRQATLPEAYIESCQQNYDPERCTFGDTFKIDDSVEKLHLGPADVRRLKELYDAQIRQLDTELGRLFARLRERGLLDRTLLVVTADHGEEFAEHGSFEHSITAYQECVRVPLLLRGPGVPAGLRVSAPVSSVDIVPTILARTGVDAPASLEGRDLSPLLRGADDEPFRKRLLYVEAAGGISSDYMSGGEFYPVYRSVRRGRYKLVLEARSGSSVLYDLATDPGEHTDVSASHPQVAAELREVAQKRYSVERARPEAPVQIDAEDAARLRALGYAP